MFELVLAKMLDVFTDSFSCSADGKHWIYTSSKGNLFFTLHIMGAMLGTGMTRAVFIKTAKTEGIFGGLDGEDDIKEVPEDGQVEAVEAPAKGDKDTKKTQ